MCRQYEDWSNYPTWCANLWLTNDEPLYRVVMGKVEEVKLDEGTKAALADWIKDLVEEQVSGELLLWYTLRKISPMFMQIYPNSWSSGITPIVVTIYAKEYYSLSNPIITRLYWNSSYIAKTSSFLSSDGSVRLTQPESDP